MIYSVKFPENTAYIHAENLKFAISTAKRLGRQVFFTTKCYVSEVKNPLQVHKLQADQAAALLGDPIPVKEELNFSDVNNYVDNLWSTLSDQLNQAGL